MINILVISCLVLIILAWLFSAFITLSLNSNLGNSSTSRVRVIFVRVGLLLLIWKDASPWDGEGFRLKNIQIGRTVSGKISCIVGMYTSDPSGQFYSLQYESSTYLGGW